VMACYAYSPHPRYTVQRVQAARPHPSRTWIAAKRCETHLEPSELFSLGDSVPLLLAPPDTANKHG